MRLWDTLFASDDRLESLLHVCCAMLEAVQDTLLERDFATSLKMLQKFPEHIDVGTILSGADRVADMVSRTRAWVRARSGAGAGVEAVRPRKPRVVPSQAPSPPLFTSSLTFCLLPL